MNTSNKALSKIISTIVISIIIFFQAALPIPAHALGISVNTLVDEDVANGTCSLREAIIAANTDAAYNGCSAGAGTDTISFGVPGTVTLSSSLPAISSNMIIDGGSSITIDGANAYRIFNVGLSVNFTLTNSILANGNSGSSNGGAMYAQTGSVVTISNATFFNNTNTALDFPNGGGAIFSNDATLYITGSTFNQNSASGFDGDGGAIESFGPSSSLNIQNSTFYGNVAGSSPNFTNSTGGAINIRSSNVFNSLTYVTVSENTNENLYGAVDIIDSSATIQNSILANSVGGAPDCSLRGTGTVTSTSNLVETDDGCDGTITNEDPQLANTLQNTGGSTETLSLGSSSPALDVATCLGSGIPGNDQRGIARPQGSGCDMGAFELDQTAPNTTIVTNPPNPDNDSTPAFTFTGDDGTGSGIASFECAIDAGGFSACTSGSTFGPLADGSHTFQVRALDRDGNVDTTPDSYTWLIDATAPDTSITVSPSNPSNASTPAFSFTGNDGSGVGVASFQCKIDGGSFTACTSGSTFGSLADGSHTFQVRAVDTLANTDPTPASYTWTIDTTAPDTSITSNPPDPDVDATPTFGFSSPDGSATFECKMDSGSFSACTSGSTFGPLADGSHTFQVRAVDAAGNRDLTPASYTWVINTPRGVGKYDDNEAGWIYVGTWTSFSGSGPSGSTLHYTNTIGNTARFTFSGTQFILSYTQNTNRGSFEVYVDGDKIATINANGALQWQKTYTSPVFLSGTHVAQFKNIGGSGRMTDVDAIEVLNTPAPGAGTYDDSSFNWRYIGKWSAFSGSGPYNNTLHYTSTVGNTAWFTFTGTQFILSYTQSTNRGSFEVYVDGNKVTTINANGALQWQKIYVSPVYSSGAHEVQFKNIGISGPVIDVDAIQVFNAPIPGSGPAYDDNDVNWSYSGKWSSFSGSGPANNTLHYTSKVGNTARFTFTGTQFTLSYTQNTNRGSFEVYVDGTKIAAINANGALQWQKTFTSPIFAAGVHVVQIKNIGGSGSIIDVDAIEILDTPIPDAGKYDDDENWFYSGKWSTFSGSGPYNSTLHYTATVGNTARFTFSGTQFILSYTQNTNRGSFEVYVDGTKIATVNANGAVQWQKTFTSPVFAAGTHVVQLKNIGGSGSITDVDAIEILDTPIPGAGPYEDATGSWVYIGSWSTFSGSGPSGSTLHYTSAVGNTAWFTFSGTQFTLSYTQSTNRGSFEVYVDGTKIATVNANGLLQWQKTYTSPTFTAGTHIVQFKNIGGSGPITDVDAITIN